MRTREIERQSDRERGGRKKRMHIIIYIKRARQGTRGKNQRKN